jgi:hypothetical protein
VIVRQSSVFGLMTNLRRCNRLGAAVDLAAISAGIGARMDREEPDEKLITENNYHALLWSYRLFA